jgi:hypothetical protein
MWLSKTISSARRVTIITLVLGLTACGFRPLYAPPVESGNDSENVYAFDIFRSVAIESIPDREGQYLRNELTRLLHPNGADRQRFYSLSIRISESERNLAVRKSSIATRANLTVRGEFSLVDRRDGKVLVSGDTSVTSGFNIFESEFQSLSALNSARFRALDSLAQQISIRLATDLSSRSESSIKP